MDNSKQDDGELGFITEEIVRTTMLCYQDKQINYKEMYRRIHDYVEMAYKRGERRGKEGIQG